MHAILDFLHADPLGWPNWQVIAAVVWLALTAILKARPNIAANEPLELLANLLVRVPLVGQVVRPWTTPGTVERTAGPPSVGLLLLVALLLPSIAHAATEEEIRMAANEAALAGLLAAVAIFLIAGWLIYRFRPRRMSLAIRAAQVAVVVACFGVAGAVLRCTPLAHADPPAAEVRPLPPAAADVVAPAPATPGVPSLAAQADCITQGAANAALACVTGKAPPPTDRRTFWITWGTSVGSTVLTAALGWLGNHYLLNPEPVK